MLVHGARAVLFRAAEKTEPLSEWINRIREKRGFNRAVIVLANKLLRVSWVIIGHNELYSPVATIVFLAVVKANLKLRRMQK